MRVPSRSNRTAGTAVDPLVSSGFERFVWGFRPERLIAMVPAFRAKKEHGFDCALHLRVVTRLLNIRTTASPGMSSQNASSHSCSAGVLHGKTKFLKDLCHHRHCRFHSCRLRTESPK